MIVGRLYRYLIPIGLCIALSAAAQPGSDARPPGYNLLGSTTAHAALPLGRFTLAQAVEAMRGGHPLFAAARANERAAAADVVGAGLWTNPIADAAYGRSFLNPQTDPVGSVGLGLTQFMETSNVPEAKQNVARFTEKAVHTEGELLRRVLALDVEAGCVALVAAAAKVQMFAEANAELDRANQIVNARVHAGAAPQYDASRIAVAVAQARAALADAHADIVQSRGALDVAVGPGAAQLTGLPDLDLFAVATPEALDALQTLTAQSRPDLVAAQQRAQAAEAQVVVARRVVLPGFSVRGGMYFGTTPGEFGGTVSVGVPLPFVDRGQGSISAAVAHAEAARATVDALALQAGQRVRSAHEETLRRRETLRQYMETGVTRSHGMAQEAEAGYRAGKLSVLELVDAYVAKRDARLRAIELATDARLAELRLRRAVQAGLSWSAN